MEIELEINNKNQSSFMIAIPKEEDPKIINTSQKYKTTSERIKLPFKKPNWNSKYRNKEKNARVTKNMKNMIQDTLDSMSYNICNY